VRDPKRIDRMLEKLAVLWKQAPDLRLGQLICNVSAPSRADPFYVEDDWLERSIELATKPVGTREGEAG